MNLVSTKWELCLEVWWWTDQFEGNNRNVWRKGWTTLLHPCESNLIHVRIWLVISALETVEDRVRTAQTTIACVTGRWNTLLDASWYRVRSRLVTIDELGMLLVCYQVPWMPTFSPCFQLSGWLMTALLSVFVTYWHVTGWWVFLNLSVSSSVVHPAVFLVFSWLIHVHPWTSAHLKPWTAQDVITPCSSHSCLTDPNSLYCGKPSEVLLLDAPECWGEFKVLGGGDRRVVLLLETHFSGWKVDRRVLATNIDAELGLITCVWSRIGQMARRSTPERIRARIQSDSSQWRRRLWGSRWWENMRKRGRRNIQQRHDQWWNDFLRHTKQIVKHLSQTCDHIWRASVRRERKVRVCAYGEVLSVHIPVAFMAVATRTRKIWEVRSDLPVQVSLY